MQTIGERLEEARKRKGISIREAAEATKIRSDYLHKFESNQFDLKLSEIYARGFLRSYAQFLQLPVEKILNDYAALGRSESKPRTPSREVYGRMDVSIASADNRATDSNASSDSPSDASAEPARRPSSLNRSSSSLPQGPSISPILIFRGGITLAAIIVIFLLIWAGKAIIGGSDDTVAKPNTNPTKSITANEASISLIAINSVRVKVTLKNTDGTPGEVLLPDTNLARGEVRTVSKPGPILIWATEGKNLQIEISGKRYPMPFEGYNRAQIN